MSGNGNLTGLAAIVSKSRAQDAEKIEQNALETAPAPVRATNHKAAKATASTQPTGAKYTDPERVQLKAYVRRNTKIDAEHKWKRENRGDVSDLIETLLSQYLHN